MKKRKLKSFVIPTIIIISTFLILLTVILIPKSNDSLKSNLTNLTYVTDSILENETQIDVKKLDLFPNNNNIIEIETYDKLLNQLL